MMNDRPTVKVNFIMDAQNKGKINFDNTVFTLRIRPKTPKIWENMQKSEKDTCPFIFEHISLLEKTGN